MANIQVDHYTIGENTYYYIDSVTGDTKVDKEEGKGLSTNDYTTAEKTKLESIEAGAEVNIPIDDELSLISEHPVQNKVVSESLADLETNKLDKDQIASLYNLGIMQVGDGLKVNNNGVVSTDIPIASGFDLGLIRVGNTLTIDENGVLDVENPSGGGYVTAGQLEGSILGNQATAEGKDVVSSSEQTHAEGLSTSAIGNYAHAEGIYTSAYGNGAHAEGVGTSTSYVVANGNGAHAGGMSTTATGDYSHSMGYKTSAYGQSSSAFGEGTVATSPHQVVIGKYNEIDTNGDYVFIIGNGTDDNNRSNALAVTWNGIIVYPNSGI